jgi:hypothetical protein
MLRTALRSSSSSSPKTRSPGASPPCPSSPLFPWRRPNCDGCSSCFTSSRLSPCSACGSSPPASAASAPSASSWRRHTSAAMSRSARTAAWPGGRSVCAGSSSRSQLLVRCTIVERSCRNSVCMAAESPASPPGRAGLVRACRLRLGGLAELSRSLSLCSKIFVYSLASSGVFQSVHAVSAALALGAAAASADRWANDPPSKPNRSAKSRTVCQAACVAACSKGVELQMAKSARTSSGSFFAFFRNPRT